MDPMLTWTHPELAYRYERLVELVWTNGWHVNIVSSTRSKAEQIDIYNRWVAGNYSAPSVANPYLFNGYHPDGWPLYGSNHMIQEDGYSHALDLGWMGCSPAQLAALAWQCGLRLTVPDENWHFQMFPHQYTTPVPIFPTSFSEDMTMSTTVYEADMRPGGEVIADFPLLVQNGTLEGRVRVVSTILIRQRPASGTDKVVAVWCDGEPKPVMVRGDGRVSEIPVWKRGFCSVGGNAGSFPSSPADGMAFEARELWVPA